MAEQSAAIEWPRAKEKWGELGPQGWHVFSVEIVWKEQGKVGMPAF